MRYYKILLDDSQDNDVICFCEDTHGIDQYHPLKGNLIQNWANDIKFYFNLIDGDRLTDYLSNNLGWFIVSTRFKDILTELGVKEIQYLAINIINSEDNKEVNGYYVANVLNVVDALNLENSDYSVVEFEGEKIYSIRKFAVNNDKVNNIDLFKLKGQEISLFASESLKALVDKNKITGCDFLEIKVI